MIDTASNTVVATVPVGVGPVGVAVTPDGTRAYVANAGFGFVSFSVIDTASNTVVDTVPGGNVPWGVAITPDGTRAYVANNGLNNVLVIDTASNTVVATVPVEKNPIWVAFTLDGTLAYVTNIVSNNVSVIDTASNTVVATVPVGTFPNGVGIIPPLPGVPFLAFSAQPKIAFGGAPNQDAFNLRSEFTLSSTASNGINPVAEAVTLRVGTFKTAIPPASFKKNEGLSPSRG